MLTPMIGADKKTLAHLKRLARNQRRNARKAASEELKKAAKDERLSKTIERRTEKKETSPGAARRRLNSFIERPTKRSAEIISEMIANKELSVAERTEAARILLNWSEGNFYSGKRKKPRDPAGG